MKGRTAKLFLALMVVAALLLAGPAWAAPKKAGAAHGEGASAVAATALKDQNRVEDQVQLENGDQVEEQNEEGDQLEEDNQQEEDQDGVEEKNRTRVENEVEQQTQTQDGEKVQDQVRLKTKAKVEAEAQEQLQHQEQEEEQKQEQEQELEQKQKKAKAEEAPATTVPKATAQRNRVGPQIFVNGQLLKDALPPVVKEGTTLVPLRALAASLKAQVAYDAATKTVTVVKQGVTIKLNLTSGTAALKDQLGQEKTIPLPVPPQVIEGYTFVPLRFIAENFAASVYYDLPTQVITIQEPDVLVPTQEPAPSVEEAAPPVEEPASPTTAPQQ